MSVNGRVCPQMAAYTWLMTVLKWNRMKRTVYILLLSALALAGCGTPSLVERHFFDVQTNLVGRAMVVASDAPDPSAPAASDKDLSGVTAQSVCALGAGAPSGTNTGRAASASPGETYTLTPNARAAAVAAARGQVAGGVESLDDRTPGPGGGDGRCCGAPENCGGHRVRTNYSETAGSEACPIILEAFSAWMSLRSPGEISDSLSFNQADSK